MSRYFPTPAECGHHTVFGSVPIRTYAGLDSAAPALVQAA